MFLNSRISYTAGDFGNVFFCIIAAFSGMLFFFFLFRTLFKNYGENILSFIGKNSFSIMTMQYYFFTLYNKLCQKLFEIDDIWHQVNTLKAIFLCLLTIVLILTMVTLFRKYSKGTSLEKIGKLFGI